MRNQSRARLLGLVTLFIGSVALAVGPPPSNQIEKVTGTKPKYNSVKTTTKINVIVTEFDPNLPEDPDVYAKEGIWPELRNAEAKLFALRIRDTLEESGVFGAVRVTPNDYAIGELYVLGQILESTSEVVRLRITIKDISDKSWFGKGRKFKHRVREYDFESPRNVGKDHYQPIYDEIVAEIVKQLARKKESYLLGLKDISSMVLARSYSAELFGQYFKQRQSKKSTVRLARLPADNDPQYLRVKSIRVREELFVDELQDHYRAFVGKIANSYSAWQKDSFPEAKEFRLARKKANRQLGLAFLAVAAAVAVDNQSDGTDGTNDTIMETAATAGAVGAIVLAYESFKTRKESKIFFEQLSEAGSAVDVDLSPKNVEFEGKTAKITGNAAQQFQEIRSFLQQVFDEEATPQRQL